MLEARFQQAAHGFNKLTAVRSEAGAWRRCTAGETPHGIVARVYGTDTFSIVTNGELDGLENLPTGGTYAVGTNGDMVVSATGIVARVVRSTTLLIDLSSTATGTSTDLSGINSALSDLTSDLSDLSATVATKADASTTITGIFSVTGGGYLTANRTLQLLNDAPNPGTKQYYGTATTGVKGWFPLVSGPQTPFNRHSAGYTVQAPVDFNGTVARSCLGL